MIGLRRDLHRELELGLHLPRTQQKVLAALDGLPLEVTSAASSSAAHYDLQRSLGTEAEVMP